MKRCSKADVPKSGGEAFRQWWDDRTNPHTMPSCEGMDWLADWHAANASAFRSHVHGPDANAQALEMIADTWRPLDAFLQCCRGYGMFIDGHAYTRDPRTSVVTLNVTIVPAKRTDVPAAVATEDAGPNNANN
jgi:hypothetical protein